MPCFMKNHKFFIQAISAGWKIFEEIWQSNIVSGLMFLKTNIFIAQAKVNFLELTFQAITSQFKELYFLNASKENKSMFTK